jgi:hypothetical protein
MSPAPVWECQCSVDVDVPISSAWRFMSDVRNWSDPPAEFGLDGPFAVGSAGWTQMPGQPVFSWILREVEPGRGYTIAGGMSLQGVEMLVHWRFDALSEGHTRLTQRLELFGENADGHVNDVRAAFEPNIEPGMRRLARMETTPWDGRS